MFSSRSVLLGALLALVACLRCATAIGEEVLVDFARDVRPERVEARHFTCQVEQTTAGAVLRLQRSPSKEWARLFIRAPQEGWDWSGYDSVVLRVTNAGDRPVPCAWRIENEGSTEDRGWRRRFGRFAPGETRALRIDVAPEIVRDRSGEPIRLIGMRSHPWGRSSQTALTPFDATRIARIHFYTYASRRPQAFVLSCVHGTPRGAWALPKDKPFFPFVDRFGQYMHRTWPGKTHSTEDMKRRARDEEADLAACRRPADWNAFGGWAAGPQLEATGHFRVQKHQSKWWLVDPDGRLFFSHGVAAVRIAGEFTPIDQRRHYFAQLPEANDPVFGSFYRRFRSKQKCYEGKRVLCYNFSDANMRLKYGPEWQAHFIDLCHRRLASWGHNTLGNWSTGLIYSYPKRRTAYTPAGSLREAKPLRGWADGKRFIDVFHPSFDAALQRLTEQVAATKDDPWCIGYFVQNEMNWDGDVIPLATLNSPPDQPAKIEFVRMVQGKYHDIAQLNQAWRTEHKAWDDLSQSTKPPDAKVARPDFDAFLRLFAERYFARVKAAVRRGAPQTLYLGCRFNTFNSIPAAVAAKYCDVVSYNYYRPPKQVETFDFPGKVDVPLIIGEWHFGALDRGQCDYGIRRVSSQDERAKNYLAYMKAALGHAQIVGAHWFRYKDQSFTGRSADGANAQNGLLDICDTPYSETIAASRKIAAQLYRLRAGE